MTQRKVTLAIVVCIGCVLLARWRVFALSAAHNLGAVALVKAMDIDTSIASSPQPGPDWQSAEEWLLLTRHWQPDALNVRRALVRLYYQQERYQDVVVTVNWSGPGTLPNETLMLLWDASYRALHPDDLPGELVCPQEESIDQIPEWLAQWIAGERLWLRGDLEEAVLAYRKALSYRYGMSRRLVWDFERVLRSWADRKLTENPGDSEALFRRGATCRILEDEECATESLSRLLLLGETVPPRQRTLALYHLGMQAYRSGDHAVAKSYLAEARQNGSVMPDLLAALVELGLESTAFTNLTPEVAVKAEHAVTSGGWRLIGLTVAPWNNIATDALLDIVLFWQAPDETLVLPNLLENVWVAGDIWLQRIRVLNLAPDPGFEWGPLCSSCFPSGYFGVYDVPPKDVAIQSHLSSSESINQKLSLLNIEKARVGIRAGPAPLFRDSVYLQAARLQLLPQRPGNPRLGYFWHTEMPAPRTYLRTQKGFGWPVGGGDAHGAMHAAIVRPVEDACVMLLVMVNLDNPNPVWFDDVLWFRVPGNPLNDASWANWMFP